MSAQTGVLRALAALMPEPAHRGSGLRLLDLANIGRSAEAGLHVHELAVGETNMDARLADGGIPIGQRQGRLAFTRAGVDDGEVGRWMQRTRCAPGSSLCPLSRRQPHNRAPHEPR